MLSRCAMCVAVPSLLAAAAGAGAALDTHALEWNRPANWGFNGGLAQGVRDDGGTVQRIATTYNPTTRRMTYSVTLSQSTGNYTIGGARPLAPKLTEGFTLMINNGTPMGNPVVPENLAKRGVMGQFFFEGYNPAVDKANATAADWAANPSYSGRVSAYAWNGKRIFASPWRDEDSFADGYASSSENEDATNIFYDPVSRLMTSVNGGRGSDDVFDVRVTNNVSQVVVGGSTARDVYSRTLSFDMDIGLIRDFVPPAFLANPSMPWYGAGFGDAPPSMGGPGRVGIWMHTYNYVRDDVLNPNIANPAVLGASAAGVDYWDVGEQMQFGTVGAGSPELGFIRDYERLANFQIDRFGWQTAGPNSDGYPFSAGHVGYFDMFGLSTTLIPAPGAAGALAAVGLLAARRRRR